MRVWSTKMELSSWWIFEANTGPISPSKSRELCLSLSLESCEIIWSNIWIVWNIVLPVTKEENTEWHQTSRPGLDRLISSSLVQTRRWDTTLLPNLGLVLTGAFWFWIKRFGSCQAAFKVKVIRTTPNLTRKDEKSNGKLLQAAWHLS